MSPALISSPAAVGENAPSDQGVLTGSAGTLSDWMPPAALCQDRATCRPPELNAPTAAPWRKLPLPAGTLLWIVNPPAPSFCAQTKSLPMWS